MQFKKKALAVCVLAAAFSSLLNVALWVSLANLWLFIAFLFGLFVSLPILIVAFEYGTYASVFTTVLTTFFLVFILSPVVALLISVFFFAPSMFIGWLMGLRQKGNRENITSWYPLSQIIFLLALSVISATIVIMLYLLSSSETMQHLNGFVDQLITLVHKSNFYSTESQELFEKAIRIHFVLGIASMIAVYGYLLHLGNLYFSIHFAEMLKSLKRPLDNWPTALRMPMIALVILGVSVIVGMLSKDETLTICMNIITSVLSTCFFISGLAFIHHITLGYICRIFLLIAIYVGLFTLILTPFFVMALILTGLFTTFSIIVPQAQK
ncbi:MAG: hypothetical protein JSC188_000571 [Candidatus Tokpelaia sp. JSC188]|nr:MAG: hypothetical protein JSC188_000571 [Candidatus Tokpelaia sp. JSC188]